MKTFAEAVAFHGHACPGLAFGFRVSEAALTILGDRARDEELVAVVENKSCAVDAIQLLTGCTFGKGNLIVNDYGKQTYTFMKRPGGEGVKIAVKWVQPPENHATKEIWQRFSAGDSSPEVMQTIKACKGKKMQAILKADLDELFDIQHINGELPEKAKVFRSIRCSKCGEKVMEPKTIKIGADLLCMPCSEITEN